MHHQLPRRVLCTDVNSSSPSISCNTCDATVFACGMISASPIEAGIAMSPASASAMTPTRESTREQPKCPQQACCIGDDRMIEQVQVFTAPPAPTQRRTKRRRSLGLERLEPPSLIHTSSRRTYQTGAPCASALDTMVNPCQAPIRWTGCDPSPPTFANRDLKHKVLGRCSLHAVCNETECASVLPCTADESLDHSRRPDAKA